AVTEVLRINPNAITSGRRAPTATLHYESEGEAEGAVHASAAGWNVFVDDASTEGAPPAGPVALTAAALGVGEVFRTVFVEELGLGGLRGAQPGSLNVVTLAGPR